MTAWVVVQTRKEWQARDSQANDTRKPHSKKTGFGCFLRPTRKIFVACSCPFGCLSESLLRTEFPFGGDGDQSGSPWRLWRTSSRCVRALDAWSLRGTYCPRAFLTSPLVSFLSSSSHQMDLVLSMHEDVPRFGHSNSIALLASTDGSAEDYKDGVRSTSLTKWPLRLSMSHSTCIIFAFPLSRL